MTDTLITRMRAGDPSAGEPRPTEAEIDAALARVLADAQAGRRPRRDPRRSRRGFLLAAAGVAGLAVVVLLLSAARPVRGPVGDREARMVLRGAAARLVLAPGRVLHTVYTGVQCGRGRITDRFRIEVWSETDPPYNNRIITAEQGARSWELANIDGRMQLFDARRNTIYTGETPPPYTVRRLADGRYRLTTHHYAAAATTITAAQLRALRADRDTIVPSGSHTVEVIPFSAMEYRPFNLRTQALALLRSPHPAVRRVRFDGRAAIEVSGSGQIPHTRDHYYVAPGTYTPVGFVIAFGDRSYVREYYSVYTLLPGGPAVVRRLVTLTGAHPHAQVNTSPAAYNAASSRLLP